MKFQLKNTYVEIICKVPSILIAGLIAREFGPTHYSQVAMYMIVWGLLSSLIHFSLPIAIDRKLPELGPKFFIAFIRFSMTITLISYIAILLLACYFRNNLALLIGIDSSLTLLLVTSIFGFIVCLEQLFESGLKAIKSAKYTSYLWLKTAIEIISILIAFKLTISNLWLETLNAFVVYGFVLFLAKSLNIFIFLYKFQSEKQLGFAIKLEALNISYKYVIGSFITFLLGQLDKIVVNKVYSSETTSNYVIATSFAAYINLIASALNSMILPEIIKNNSNLARQREIILIYQLFHLTTYTFAIILTFFLSEFVFGTLLGPAYTIVPNLFIIYLIYWSIEQVQGVEQFLLIAHNKYKSDIFFSSMTSIFPLSSLLVGYIYFTKDIQQMATFFLFGGLINSMLRSIFIRQMGLIKYRIADLIPTPFYVFWIYLGFSS